MSQKTLNSMILNALLEVNIRAEFTRPFKESFEPLKGADGSNKYRTVLSNNKNLEISDSYKSKKAYHQLILGNTHFDLSETNKGKIVDFIEHLLSDQSDEKIDIRLFQALFFLGVYGANLDLSIRLYNHLKDRIMLIDPDDAEYGFVDVINSQMNDSKLKVKTGWRTVHGKTISYDNAKLSATDNINVLMIALSSQITKLSVDYSILEWVLKENNVEDIEVMRECCFDLLEHKDAGLIGLIEETVIKANSKYLSLNAPPYRISHIENNSREFYLQDESGRFINIRDDILSHYQIHIETAENLKKKISGVQPYHPLDKGQILPLLRASHLKVHNVSLKEIGAVKSYKEIIKTLNIDSNDSIMSLINKFHEILYPENASNSVLNTKYKHNHMLAGTLDFKLKLFDLYYEFNKDAYAHAPTRYMEKELPRFDFKKRSNVVSLDGEFIIRRSASEKLLKALVSELSKTSDELTILPLFKEVLSNHHAMMDQAMMHLAHQLNEFSLRTHDEIMEYCRDSENIRDGIEFWRQNALMIHQLHLSEVMSDLLATQGETIFHNMNLTPESIEELKKVSDQLQESGKYYQDYFAKIIDQCYDGLINNDTKDGYSRLTMEILSPYVEVIRYFISASDLIAENVNEMGLNPSLEKWMDKRLKRQSDEIAMSHGADDRDFYALSDFDSL